MKLLQNSILMFIASWHTLIKCTGKSTCFDFNARPLISTMIKYDEGIEHLRHLVENVYTEELFTHLKETSRNSYTGALISVIEKGVANIRDKIADGKCMHAPIKECIKVYATTGINNMKSAFNVESKVEEWFQDTGDIDFIIACAKDEALLYYEESKMLREVVVFYRQYCRILKYITHQLDSALCEFWPDVKETLHDNQKEFIKNVIAYTDECGVDRIFAEDYAFDNTAMYKIAVHLLNEHFSARRTFYTLAVHDTKSEETESRMELSDEYNKAKNILVEVNKKYESFYKSTCPITIDENGDVSIPKTTLFVKASDDKIMQDVHEAAMKHKFVGKDILIVGIGDGITPCILYSTDGKFVEAGFDYIEIDEFALAYKTFDHNNAQEHAN